MNAAFRSVTPVIETYDIASTVQFYTRLLGFTIDETGEARKTREDVSLHKDGTHLRLRRSDRQYASPFSLSGTLCFYTNDINAIWETVKHTCEIVCPLEESLETLRKCIIIKDNNGYLLEFEQPVKNVEPFDKFFPPGFSLETERILMRPMTIEDAASFTAITQSSFLWKYFTRELNNDLQLYLWIGEALQEKAAAKRVPFTIIDKNSGHVCGSTSFGNISFNDRRIEIGWSWLGEQYLGSGINRHCKFALLQYAFEKMLFERVEIKTDNLNERAKQALKNIGAREEGVLRNHMQMPHDRRRDSVYFSVIKTEWPGIKNSFVMDK